MKRDEVDALLKELKEEADYLAENVDMVSARLVRRAASAIISLHQSYVNEAYRSRGMQPWMRSSKE